MLFDETVKVYTESYSFSDDERQLFRKLGKSREDKDGGYVSAGLGGAIGGGVAASLLGLDPTAGAKLGGLGGLTTRFIKNKLNKDKLKKWTNKARDKGEAAGRGIARAGKYAALAGLTGAGLHMLSKK